MLQCGHVPRRVSLEFRALALPLFALTCGLASACTNQPADESIPELIRHVPASTGQNGALSFDGVADYATSGTAQFPAGHDPQTVSLWFEVDASVGVQGLMTLRKDFDSGLELGLRDGVVSVWRVLGDRLLLAAKAPVSTGLWHHVAFTFDRTTEKLYVDGMLAASSTALPDDRTPTTCWLGTLDGTRDLLRGELDDLRVFSVVRSAAEIADEYLGKFSIHAPGLVLDLTCNESGGNTLFDRSPFANDGDLGDGFVERMPKRITSGTPDDEQ